MKLGDRLDGHMVQGHVIKQQSVHISEENGSWYFYFEYQISSNLTIEKGSISINGVSLTIIDSMDNRFSVATNHILMKIQILKILKLETLSII